MGNYLIIGICAAIGSIAMLAALKMIVQNYVFIRTARKSSAKVINFANSSNSDGHLMYLPVLEFKTPEGRIVRFNSTVASNPPAYRIGDQVKIYYPARNPQAARIDSIFEIWFVPSFSVLLGIAFFGGAALAFWVK
jgi:hypothetical protein